MNFHNTYQMNYDDYLGELDTIDCDKKNCHDCNFECPYNDNPLLRSE